MNPRSILAALAVSVVAFVGAPAVVVTGHIWYVSPDGLHVAECPSGFVFYHEALDGTLARTLCS